MTVRRVEGRTATARVFAVTSLALASLALHAVLLGGFVIDRAGFRLSVRSPLPVLVVAVVAAVAAIAAARRGERRELTRWLFDPTASGRSFAALLAVVVAVVGAIGGVEVAGSADASGYVAEARLLANIRRAGKGRTVVLVTHRPAVIEACDRVLLLERGRLVLSGAPAEALARLRLPAQAGLHAAG